MLDMIADEVSLVVDFEDIPEPYRSDHDVMFLGQKCTALPRPLDRLGQYWQTQDHTRLLTEAIRRNDVDCVFIHFLVYAVKFRRVWRSTEKPIFVHCHGWDVTWDLQRAKPGITGRTNVHPRGYQEAIRKLPANVRFIANSWTTADSLVSIGIDRRRIGVKYLGVPCGNPPSASNRSWAGDRVLTVLYLGRLVDFKGPDATIRAFARARELGLHGRLVIAGDGPLRAACESTITELSLGPYVELKGAVSKEEGERLRQQADIFTAHSQTGPRSGQAEALGVGFLEAMAAGLPVVTGRSGSLPEIVREGESGVLFEPGDIEAHAQSLAALGRDATWRARMGDAARGYVRCNFSLEAEEKKLRRILGLEEMFDR